MERARSIIALGELAQIMPAKSYRWRVVFIFLFQQKRFNVSAETEK